MLHAPDISLIGAGLAIGFAGSFHCVAMCGPFAVLAGAKSGKAGLASYSLGRLTTYSLLGAIAGGFGSLIYQLRMVGLLLAAVVVLGVGLHLFGKLPVPAFIGRVTQPLVTKMAASTRAKFALGLSTALLPCGLVYAATGVALASGTPATGALVMAAFGLSTWPALFVFGLGGHKLLKFGPNVQKWAAVLATCAGLWAVGHRMPAPPEAPSDEALPSCCQGNVDSITED